MDGVIGLVQGAENLTRDPAQWARWASNRSASRFCSYEVIKSHPTVRELYASKLVAQGVLTAEQVKEMQDAATARITEAHKNVKSGASESTLTAPNHCGNGREPAPKTAVGKNKLLRWSDAVVAAPEGFNVNKKLLTQFQKRAQTLKETGELDWALAFASLISEGTPVRISGQDTERGTFSHRHAVLRDAKTGEKYAPLQHIEDARASFEIYNSPLSEYATLGFEYGYGLTLPSALVLWEAHPRIIPVTDELARRAHKVYSGESTPTTS